jgi:hypothetical protein
MLFQNVISVAALEKDLILAFQKWKAHFLCDEKENGLRGVAQCPKD